VAKEGKKQRKYGRHSRAASNAGQKMRSERNKRLHKEAAHRMKMQQPASGEVRYGHSSERNDRPSKMAWMLLNRVPSSPAPDY